MTAKRARFTLRMTREMYEQLSKVATSKGIAMNSEIVGVLWRYLEEIKGESRHGKR